MCSGATTRACIGGRSEVRAAAEAGCHGCLNARLKPAPPVRGSSPASSRKRCDGSWAEVFIEISLLLEASACIVIAREKALQACISPVERGKHVRTERGSKSAWPSESTHPYVQRMRIGRRWFHHHSTVHVQRANLQDRRNLRGSGSLPACLADSRDSRAPVTGVLYHTRQAFSGTMGWPGLQPKAFWNSGMFSTTPFTRQRPGEWGSVRTPRRSNSGVLFWHQTRAKPRK
jgi:hypothetical protein